MSGIVTYVFLVIRTGRWSAHFARALVSCAAAASSTNATSSHQVAPGPISDMHLAPEGSNDVPRDRQAKCNWRVSINLSQCVFALSTGVAHLAVEQRTDSAYGGTKHAWGQP